MNNAEQLAVSTTRAEAVPFLPTDDHDQIVVIPRAPRLCCFYFLRMDIRKPTRAGFQPSRGIRGRHGSPSTPGLEELGFLISWLLSVVSQEETNGRDIRGVFVIIIDVHHHCACAITNTCFLASKAGLAGVCRAIGFGGGWGVQFYRVAVWWKLVCGVCAQNRCAHCNQWLFGMSGNLNICETMSTVDVQ